jgi:hypothetical protein
MGPDAFLATISSDTAGFGIDEAIACNNDKGFRTESEVADALTSEGTVAEVPGTEEDPKPAEAPWLGGDDNGDKIGRAGDAVELRRTYCRVDLSQTRPV